jgi:glutathione peroxidase
MNINSTFALAVLVLAACQGAPRESGSARSDRMNPPAGTEQTPGEIQLVSISGDTTRLTDLGGKAFLVVNVASECGMTPQYEGLEELYGRYKERGLVVVGFPCNQFGGQEPGSEEQIRDFCRTQYGVSFPMMSKIEVNGEGQHALYRYLTRRSARPGDIKWNFTKFLLDSTLQVVARFEPAVEPTSEQVTKAVEELL